MSVYLLGRIISCLVFGGLIAWMVFSRYDSEVGSEKQTETDIWGHPKQRYYPHFPGYLLPIMILTILLLTWIIGDPLITAETLLSICFSIFLHICAYYLLLLPLLPFLRRHFSARTCATLWLIPNYLYVTQMSSMKINRPLLILKIPGNWVWVAFFVWLAGFVCVFLWKIAEHLRFRKRVLNKAVPVDDLDTLILLSNVIQNAQLRKADFELVTSPHVRAPLSVGLFQRTIRIILPQKKYTAEELELILRHEIVHIGREDAWSKFFMVFCSAMCWFNPLMWIAMRKSAEDTELSCDETVLLDADDAERKKYATVLLDSAQDERGFSTCLSASAEAMRYRLKNITKPAKKRTGALLAGFLMALLIFSCGFVTLAYGDLTGREAIYSGEDSEDFSLEVHSINENADSDYLVLDEAALHAYLSSLKLRKIIGHYALSEDSSAVISLRSGNQYLFLTFLDDTLRAQPLFNNNTGTKHYCIEDNIDWAYINTLILPNAPLQIQLTKGDHGGHALHAIPYQIWKVNNDQKQLIYETEFSAEDIYRLGSSQFQELTISFPYPLEEPCTIEIGSENYTVTQADVTPELIMKAPNSSALYNITACYRYPNGDIYEASYRFFVEYLVS